MYVVYDIKSTMQVGPLPRCGKAHTMYAKDRKHAGVAARLAAQFNAKEHGPDFVGPGRYGWCHADHYHSRVVKMVERVNMMSGGKYFEPSNTPGYCSPSREAYWSM